MLHNETIAAFFARPVAIMLINREVNTFLGIPSNARRDLEIAQIEHAQAHLEAIGDAVEADVKKRIA